MGAALQLQAKEPPALPTEPVLTIGPDGVGFTTDAEDGLGYPGGRPHRVRARTVSIKRLAKRDLERGARHGPLQDARNVNTGPRNASEWYQLVRFCVWR
jgi:hypothetical protein